MKELAEAAIAIMTEENERTTRFALGAYIFIQVHVVYAFSIARYCGLF